MANLTLEPLTERTITDKDELIAQLKQIRRQGYAVDAGERIHGAMCISVPIKNYVLPATLGILGPESRMKPRLTDFINELVASGTRISNSLKQVFTVK